MSGLSPRHEALDEQLCALAADGETMLLSEFDGFVTGLIVCPDLIPPSEWLPAVWGDADDDSAPAFESEHHAHTVMQLVMEHYNSVADELHHRPKDFAPIFEVDTITDETLWELWIAGFEAAMALRPSAWARILDSGDEDAQTALACLLTLCAIDRGESDLAAEAIEDLTQSAPDLIPVLVRTLSTWRRGASGLGRPANTSRSTKVGRNDPCPCGSGKKYKKCCGLG